MTLTTDNLVGGQYQANQKFCVFRLGGGTFQIKAEGTEVSNNKKFELKGSPSNSVNYFLIIDHINNSNPQKFRKQGQTKYRNAWKGDCPPSDINHQQKSNMDMDIRVKKSDVDKLPAGVYSDTMTLTVSPIP